MDKNKNTSEELFKPRLSTPETSGIIGYHSDSQAMLDEKQESEQNAWYRQLPRPQWAWQGLDPIEIESVLSRIASSSIATNHPKWLDTVAGFRHGNWCYEWTQQGMMHQRSALHADDLSAEQKSRQLFVASLCFSLASYPHLKQDTLSLQAQVLANKAYVDAMEASPYILKQIEVPYQGKKVLANLHLPHETEKPLPVVIVSGGMGSLQTDLWRLFTDYLAKHSIAMLTLDLPGAGHSSSFALTEDSSSIHQALLEHLPQVPWVDHFNVHFMGFRFGGNSLVRLAFLKPDKVKSCIALGAPIESLFKNPEQIANMPKMYLDMLASRMGKRVVDIPTFSRILNAWSLKSQGILAGRTTPVPMLALTLEGDPVSSKQDNQSIATYSQGGKAINIKAKTLHQGYEEALKNVTDWLITEINR